MVRLINYGVFCCWIVWAACACLIFVPLLIVNRWEWYEKMLGGAPTKPWSRCSTGRLMYIARCRWPITKTIKFGSINHSQIQTNRSKALVDEISKRLGVRVIPLMYRMLKEQDKQLRSHIAVRMSEHLPYLPLEALVRLMKERSTWPDSLIAGLSYEPEVFERESRAHSRDEHLANKAAYGELWNRVATELGHRFRQMALPDLEQLRTRILLADYCYELREVLEKELQQRLVTSCQEK